jgi:hypothetical protein
MSKFAYLCIMAWIQMDAHEYICFFSKFEDFMYFLVNRFCGPFFFLFQSGVSFWVRLVRF